MVAHCLVIVQTLNVECSFASKLSTKEPFLGNFFTINVRFNCITSCMRHGARLVGEEEEKEERKKMNKPGFQPF